jgi:hypothetical protein
MKIAFSECSKNTKLISNHEGIEKGSYEVLTHVLILSIAEKLRSNITELTGTVSATCNILSKFGINCCCISI